MNKDTKEVLQRFGAMLSIIVFGAPMLAFFIAFIGMWTFPHVVDAFWKPYSAVTIYNPSWGEWFAFGWFTVIIKYALGRITIKSSSGTG